MLFCLWFLAKRWHLSPPPWLPFLPPLSAFWPFRLSFRWLSLRLRWHGVYCAKFSWEDDAFKLKNEIYIRKRVPFSKSGTLFLSFALANDIPSPFKEVFSSSLFTFFFLLHILSMNKVIKKVFVGLIAEKKEERDENRACTFAQIFAAAFASNV